MLKPKKAEKPLVVFDRLSGFWRIPLNDMIMQGRDWTASMIEIVCCLGLDKIEVSAHIRGMFLFAGIAGQIQQRTSIQVAG